MAQFGTVMINTGDLVNDDDGQSSEKVEFEESLDPNNFECIICLMTIEGKVMGCETCISTILCQSCVSKLQKCPTCRKRKYKEKSKFIHRLDKEQEIKAYQTSRCEKHPLRGCKIFCVNCEVSACEDCMAESHVGHKRKRLSSQSEKLAEQI